MRKFLYTVVVLILLAAAALFALRLYGDKLAEVALVPKAPFATPSPLADNAYADPAMWFSRPGMGPGNDPARWQPAYDDEDSGPVATPSPEPSAVPSPAATPAPAPAQPVPQFAVFFVHPTSFYSSRSWNAPLDDSQSQQMARMTVHAMASAFNQASEIWAPRYRQATFGAFLTDDPAGQKALDTAYKDVEQAFDSFLASIKPDTPIVLAGHDQGAYLIERLLHDRIAGTPLQGRIAMAYPIGWPTSIAHDLPKLGLPACATPQQGGCIVTWSSFAEPADPGLFLKRYRSTPGLDGKPRGDGPMLCVNPLTGMLGGAADRMRDKGTLVPDDSLSDGILEPRMVGARCNSQGLLLIGAPPDLGPYVLPGNNYHVYDIPLFWANLQADVVRRVRAWQASHS